MTRPGGQQAISSAVFQQPARAQQPRQGRGCNGVRGGVRHKFLDDAAEKIVKVKDAVDFVVRQQCL
jgi:hypothetical protein